MLHNFYYRTYPEACKITTHSERVALARQAYSAATQQNLPGMAWLVLYEPAKGLKFVVEWPTHTVHILTNAEAQRQNLPPVAMP